MTDDALERAFFDVESKHHFHRETCTCGFNSDRSRSRTEHITEQIRLALDVERRRGGEKPQASKTERLIYEDYRDHPEMTLQDFHERHGILYVAGTADQLHD